MTVFKPGEVATEAKLNAGDEGKVVFHAYRAAAQSIANATEVAISWDTVVLDTLTGWAAGSPTRYTPNVAGYYEITGGIGYAVANSTTVRASLTKKNGASVVGSGIYITSAWGATYQAVIPLRTITVAMNGSTDYIEVYAYHAHGSAVNTANALTTEPTLTITYSGAL